MGLHDMVLVKDNHVAAAGGVTAALEAVASRNRAALPVELEVRTLDELQEALDAKPRPARILLDNMTVATMEEAVRVVGALPSPRPLLEASGNLDLQRVAAVARTGVDLLSVGALTHSAPVADLSLLLESGWAPR
jgi:nicotinate-nucleotide pyrophosphorylase (carboxylating)